MFQLFKNRNFSDYISDTFAFFKKTGKHFFTHYFIINGGFLLILSVLFYFVFKVYFEVLFSNIGSVNQDFGNLESYFNNNIALIIVVVVVLFLLILLVSLLNFAYPIIYLNLYDKNKGDSFTTSDVLKEMKNNLGRLLGYFIKLFLISIPIILVLGGIMVLLMFIIIGIPLLFIIMPAYLAWMNLSLYVYMNSKTSFLNALGKGFQLMKEKFWPIVGSNLVMVIIVQIVLTVLTMIPYIIGMASIFTSDQVNNSDGTETFSFLGIVIAIIFVFSILINYILNNIILINNGVIYYSLRENKENNQQQSEIDSIGSNHD